MVIVVIGVAGSGKSTVGEALAAALGWDFQEGDALHPAANIARMRARHALDDDDRRPWLARIAAWIANELRRGRHGVVACSALKRAYRDRLRTPVGEVRFVALVLPRETLARRLQQRRHFMPPALLDSQLDAWEEPLADEGALIIPADAPLSDIVERIRLWIGARD